MPVAFEPLPFRPHPLLRNGHLQTLASLRLRARLRMSSRAQVLPLGDGDAVVLHDDCPVGWSAGDPAVLLVHGLCGCHSAGYMVRIAHDLFTAGIRCYRLDLRGCGAGAELASGLAHAGRSDDVIRSLDQIATETSAGALRVVGVSLGGNLVLRALGRIGAGQDPTPPWFGRIDRVAVVAPPIDLARCSENMGRWQRLPYNRYFIRRLLENAPERVRRQPVFDAALGDRLPKTIWELDERITAPLSGFAGALDYYKQSSASPVVRSNPVPTLILAAADDPIVPVGCFQDVAAELPETTRLWITRHGGHVGYIDASRRSWMDQVVIDWLKARTA